MFHRLGAGEPAPLGYVGDEERGHPPELGEAGELRRRLPHLLDPPHLPPVGPGDHRLEGIHDEGEGRDFLHRGGDSGKGLLGEEVEPLSSDPQPLGPELHLGGGFLPGHVEDRAVVPGEASGDLEEQRGLTHPGFTPEEDHRPGDEPASEQPVHLGEPSGKPCQGS